MKRFGNTMEYRMKLKLAVHLIRLGTHLLEDIQVSNPLVRDKSTMEVAMNAASDFIELLSRMSMKFDIHVFDTKENDGTGFEIKPTTSYVLMTRGKKNGKD